MPKAYSCDLRERVIEMVEAGASRHEAAEHFGVAVSTVVKWMQHWKECRSAAPKPRGGSVSPLERQAERLVTVIREQPDLTLEETAAEQRRYRIRTSRSSLSRFFHRHDITVKKSLQAAERQRADVVRARRRWMREQGMFDPARLVFIDETAVSTNLVRLKGRAPRGVRLIGHVPLGEWKTVTFIAALRHNKMVAPMVIEGAINGEIFLAYVQQVLVPTLRRNDIVVLDNYPSHKVAGVEETIEQAGATVRYLPRYSPDLNPIEMPYSKFKAMLRKAAGRTISDLYRTIRSLIPQLGARECANYFKHAGYVSI